ncbi:MAG: GNAT family N-acetyltransferase [Methanomassiliicoccaceae archaeon]|nr:GNAT family N-acetyltransferase [Methanomassiliicoccaceae archaeon]
MMIREYEERDSERLYEILLSSLDESYREEMFSFFRMQWPKGQLVACDFAGRPVGFIFTTKVDDRHVRIMMFAVDSAHRSMGIGSKLLVDLMRAAMMNGMTHISLEVRPSNMRAIGFYKRHGFAPTEILRSYYNDGGDAVRMDMILN